MYAEVANVFALFSFQSLGIKKTNTQTGSDRHTTHKQQTGRQTLTDTQTQTARHRHRKGQTDRKIDRFVLFHKLSHTPLT